MLRGVLLGTVIGLAGCTGGGSSGLFGAGGFAAGTVGTDGGCIGFCGDAGAGTALNANEVGRIISQAVFEANARNTNAVIAVVDRVGNVLAVFDTAAAAADTVPAGTVNITSNLGVTAPFSGATLDGQTFNNAGNFNATGLAAISKAITGAYLSSEGNAFTTRTANQIVQEAFNPGENSQPGGPLFGVQFSQLFCSDITSTRAVQAAQDGATRRPVAPRASPFGLAADPGGLPLYKGGVPVGGIGVLSDGVYGIDRNIANVDNTGVASNDEGIALAGTFGFAAPSDRRADRITVDGKLFRFTDVENFDLLSNPANAPAFANNGTLGRAAGTGFLVDVGTAAAGGNQLFYDAPGAGNAPLAGQAFGKAGSGVRPAADAGGFGDANYQAALAARDAFVLVDNAEQVVFEARAGSGGVPSVADVQQLVLSALDVANATRAQIRRPVNSQMRASISVVDSDTGDILALVRTRDGPMFGTDVSLQKARTAAFFSRANAGTILDNATDSNLTAGTLARRADLAQGVAAVQDHTAVGATALLDGIAFADRSGGNLSRPNFPDGVAGRLPGPFSNPIGRWSPFATGLQLELVFGDLLRFLTVAANQADAERCADAETTNVNNGGQFIVRNGIQIFPGSVPVYVNGALEAGIGISGDGIDQDDMTAFLGTHNAGVIRNNGLGNAAKAIRADTIAVQPFSSIGTPVGASINLRYVQCPQGPFLNSSQQQPCDGK